MTTKELLSLSTEDRCNFYRQKIAEHYPPKSDLDKRLILNLPKLN